MTDDQTARWKAAIRRAKHQARYRRPRNRWKDYTHIIRQPERLRTDEDRPDRK